MKIRSFFALCFLALHTSTHATDYQWTNTLGGNWAVAANWSPFGIPGSLDRAYITNNGTYTVTVNATVGTPTFELGGGSGTKTLVVDGGATLTLTGSGRVLSGGVLVASNCWMSGRLIVQTGGQLQLSGSGSKVFYSLQLLNQGTVTWGGGNITVGGSPVTLFTNEGLWQVTGNDSMYSGGGSALSMWYNSGTLRKSAGTGSSSIDGMNFLNQSGGSVEALSGRLNLSGFGTNPISGTFNAAIPGLLNIANGTWTDAGGIFTGNGTNQFGGGKLNLRTNVPAGLKLVGGEIYITNTFQEAGAITNLTLEGSLLRGSNRVDNGVLVISNGISGSVLEHLTIQANGQLVLAGANKLLYSATIINQGTVQWDAGGLSVGGNPGTIISNGGLWNITSSADIWTSHGGGQFSLWTNSGTLRKNAGNSNSIAQIDGFAFLNQSGGLVDSQAGIIRFTSGSGSVLGGTFNAAASAATEIKSGAWTDGGGITTGSGIHQFTGGAFTLRTNTIPGLKLVGGDVYIASTFQQAGAITNLTLDGSFLRGTNRVDNGVLTLNSGGTGSVLEHLTVQPNGQLVLANANKLLYSSTIINQGTVLWNGGILSVGGNPGTVISNGGLWQVNGDLLMSYGGNQIPVWTNSGTLRKTVGGGTAQITGINFNNQPGGLVQVDAGTLQLSTNLTQTGGTFRLNGGRLTGNGTFTVNGSAIDGTGSFGANSLLGGTISPGLSGPGLISFTSGLNLGAGTLLTLGGVGTVPGAQYDQLSVTGAVVLANATLQITSLPEVPVGAAFVIITNDGTDAVSGTFNGLPENAIVMADRQPFRIHYAGGSGNDVTLVRNADAPQLLSLSLTNGVSQFSGVGSVGGVYTIQATTNFINWTNIGTATGDAAGNIIFIDTNAAIFPYRFYRTTN